MGVNRATRFACSFNFNSVLTGFDAIAGIFAFDDEIGVAIEIAVFYQRSGMLGETGSQHVGQDPRHDRRPKHVVESIKSLFNKTEIYVEEEIINILDGELEIFKAKFVGQDCGLVESVLRNAITGYRHD